MKRIIIIIVLLLSVSALRSQVKGGDNLLGVSLGFWAKANSPMLGVNFESHIAETEAGTVGLGGLFRYYSYGVNYSNGDSRRYSFSSLGFQANFNFNQIGNGKFVPYIGAVVGYNKVSNTYTNVTQNNVFINDVSYTSGAWLWGQLGARYFFSRSVAGSVRVGFGNNDFNTLELGMDFGL